MASVVQTGYTTRTQWFSEICINTCMYMHIHDMRDVRKDSKGSQQKHINEKQVVIEPNTLCIDTLPT